MPTIISSTATFVQASGIDNRTLEVQFGQPSAITEILKFQGPSNTGTLTAFGSTNNHTKLTIAGSLSQSGFIINPSNTALTSTQTFISYTPDFSRGTTLFGVLGTTGTVERFFDRSPFYFTPSEIDPNTLRDISEAQQFMLYSSATIDSYDYARHISSTTTLITAKGSEFAFLNEPINLIRNGSFEQDLTNWDVSKGTGADSVTTVTAQPTGVGFDDSNAVSPVQGQRMAWMSKVGATGSLRLSQHSGTGATYSSSLLSKFSFGICPETGLSGSSNLVIDFQFFLDNTKQYEILYRFSGSSDPNPLASGISIAPTDFVTLSAPTADIFNVYQRDFQLDSGHSDFLFNYVDAHVIIDSPGGTTFDLLLDDVQVTLNLPSEELRQTASLAHILTANPTTSGFPFTVSGSDTIQVVDQTPPFFDEVVPASGSSFNNPNTDVTLHIKDAGSALNQGTINVWIDSLQVVSAGTVVTGTTWPSIQKTVVSPSDTLFIFNRSTDFPYQSTVLISGTAQDLADVSNQFSGYYSFKIWGVDNISGTITGLPDATPPTITPLYPVDLQTNVSPNTDIVWLVSDDARGVDPASVRLYLNGALKVNGDSNVTGGTLSRTGSPVSGYTYTYNSTGSFTYGETVTGTLQASDVVGNSSALTYTFVVTSSETLFISNFFLNSGASTLLVSGTNIYVDITDATYGVDTSNSYLHINGSSPVGLTTSGITDGIRFIVPALPLVDFREDLNILVHAQNNFPGSYPVIKEETFVLRPGYRVVWYNREQDEYESTFPFITNIPVLTDVKNYARRSATGSLYYRFLTEDQPKADLSASIVSNIKTADLPAVVESDNPFFEYGKTIVLEIEADDLVGNQLRFSHTFVIEQRSN